MIKMGELQKRIKVNTHDVSDLQRMTVGFVDRQAVLTTTINKIVEEMVKEFPDLFKDVESKQLSNEEFTNLLVKQNRERLCWLRRWLKPKCLHENLKTPKVNGCFPLDFSKSPHLLAHFYDGEAHN